MIGKAHSCRAQQCKDQSNPVENELSAEVADGCCQKGARQVAGVVDGCKPTTCQICQTSLVTHDGEHWRVGEACKPYRKDKSADAGENYAIAFTLVCACYCC